MAPQGCVTQGATIILNLMTTHAQPYIVVTTKDGNTLQHFHKISVAGGTQGSKIQHQLALNFMSHQFFNVDFSFFCSFLTSSIYNGLMHEISAARKIVPF